MNYFGRKSLLNNLDGKIIHVYLTKNHLDIIEKLKLKNIKYNIVDQSYFNSFDLNLNHQGIHTVIESRVNFESINDYLENTTGARTVLMIDSITDPFNFGSIIRTSEFFGVDLIIYKKDNQVQINDFVIKTSMGAINNINMLKVTNLAVTIDILKKYGY
jgi:23S rRNA (guanosine2251-2'-O)-methyltransferase